MDSFSKVSGELDGPDVLALDRPVPVIRARTPPIPRWRIENRVVSLAGLRGYSITAFVQSFNLGSLLAYLPATQFPTFGRHTAIPPVL
ncbi:hypothetical protein AUI46_03310 [archaeon 13_1_40CM_2_52_13]|nr:MAG: hypothetical protein AUI46_03310 [archaeon 13_1_40CM_2_52_13]